MALLLISMSFTVGNPNPSEEISDEGSDEKSDEKSQEESN